MNIANKLSLKSLHLLSIVAKSDSLLEAANELNISVSAVSHQLKRLEDKLGFSLTQKQGKTLTLTANVREYALQLSEHFDAISRLTAQFVGESSQPMTLGIESAFAVHRLTPALSLWQNELANSDIRIRMLNCDDKASDLCLDMVFGNQVKSLHYKSKKIKAQEYIAVCTPHYLHSLSNDNVLLEGTLLDIEQVNGWQAWVEQSTFSISESVKKVYFSHTILLLQATINHQGIALLESSLIKDELAQGTLVKAHPFSLQLEPLNYYWSWQVKHQHQPIVDKLEQLISGLLVK